MAQNLTIVIVEKTGTLKTTSVKDYKEDDLFKKCGFKKADGFSKQTEWTTKIDGKRYIVALFAKKDGRANTENKYDFQPPVDNDLYFGSCALIARLAEGSDDAPAYVSLTLELWEKIYEKLFGGFENLDATCAEDEEEEDELESIPIEKKTKQGYLKDGFVVDSDDDDNDDDDDSSDSSDDSDDSDDDEDDTASQNGGDETPLELEDIGSELSSEEYDYDDEKNDAK